MPGNADHDLMIATLITQVAATMSLLVEKGILTNDEIEVRISIINAGLAEECIQKHGDAAKVFISRLMEWNK